MRAADEADLGAAAGHLSRAHIMLDEGASTQRAATYDELARTCARLGDKAGTAENWRTYLSLLGSIERRMAVERVESDLGDMAKDPQVLAVTEEFRPRELDDLAERFRFNDLDPP